MGLHRGNSGTSTGRPSEESIVKVLPHPSVSIMFHVSSLKEPCIGHQKKIGMRHASTGAAVQGSLFSAQQAMTHRTRADSLMPTSLN